MHGENLKLIVSSNSDYVLPNDPIQWKERGPVQGTTTLAFPADTAEKYDKNERG